MAVNATADLTIGPIFPGRDDFTLGFEEWIFMILPAILLIIATPIKLRQLLQHQPAVGSGLLLWAKLVSTLYFHVVFEQY